MNHHLQPRTDPMLSHTYPVYALSGLYCLWLLLPAHPSNMPEPICFNELPVQPLAPHANPDHPTHQKQLNPIQCP